MQIYKESLQKLQDKYGAESVKELLKNLDNCSHKKYIFVTSFSKQNEKGN